MLADDGVDLILATQPYLYRDDLTGKELERVQLAPAFFHDERGRASVSSVRAAMEAANTVTARVAARRGVPLVDLEAVVPKSLDYFLDDVHYTEQGNRLVADAFAEELLETGWITARLAGEPR